MLTTERRVAVRDSSRGWMKYILEDIDKLNKEEQFNFFEELAMQCAKKIDKKVVSEEKQEMMTDEQATAFEKIAMPFGKYSGTPIGELSWSYLCQLLDPNDFIKKLKKYVAFCNSNHSTRRSELKQQGYQDD